MNKTTTDLMEEFNSRREAEAWDLRACPCCGSPAAHVRSSVTGEVTISCSIRDCKRVSGKSMADAAYIWNTPDFRERA